MATAADKSEEQILRERNAVEAMKNAKANMGAALDRIDTLERALRSAADALSRFKKFVPEAAYSYAQKRLHDEMDDAVAAARKLLA